MHNNNGGRILLAYHPFCKDETKIKWRRICKLVYKVELRIHILNIWSSSLNSLFFLWAR